MPKLTAPLPSYNSSSQRSGHAARRCKLESEAGDLFIGAVSAPNKLWTQAQKDPAVSIVNDVWDDEYEGGKDIDISQDPTDIMNHIAATKSSAAAKKPRSIAPSQATSADHSTPVRFK